MKFIEIKGVVRERRFINLEHVTTLKLKPALEELEKEEEKEEKKAKAAKVGQKN